MPDNLPSELPGTLTSPPDGPASSPVWPVDVTAADPEVVSVSVSVSALSHAPSSDSGVTPTLPTIIPPWPAVPPPPQDITPSNGLPTVPGYHVLAELGRGGMGVVYLARQANPERLVALKMLLPDRASRRAFARFRAEAQAVARLQHPNIVQVYQVSEIANAEGGQPFFSLEYCSGGSLEKRLSAHPLPARQAARLVQTLARAMHFAHAYGLIHRDLKPGNVLLGPADPDDPDQPFGVPKITDFGLAKQLDDSTPGGHTRDGEVMGTPPYMAPEQARGHIKDLDVRTDVYALGAILYECLTGRAPFCADSVHDTLEQVLTRDPVPPKLIAGSCPRDLETICLKCLRKEPARRYQSALELAEDLGRFRQGESILARPVGHWERAIKWCRRHRALATFWAAVGVLVVFFLLGGLAHGWRLREQAIVLRQEAHRADAEKWISEGKIELDRNTREALREAHRLFLQARDRITQADADANEELRQLRQRAADLLGEANHRLDEWEKKETARKNYDRLFRLYNEAFFLLNRDLFTGQRSSPTGPSDCVVCAREALDLFLDKQGEVRPDLLAFFDPPQRDQLRDRLYELFLILAEALARPLPGQADQERKERLDEALVALDRASLLAEDRDRYTLRARRARYLALLGRGKEADAERARADRLQPQTALGWFLRGYDRGLADEADAREALADFDRALDKQPDLFWARFFRALAYQKLRKPAEAHATLTICLRERPSDFFFFWIYHLRGSLAAQMDELDSAEGDFDRAEAVLNKGPALPPDDPAHYALLLDRGYLALRRKQVPAAIHLFRSAASLRQDYNAYTYLAAAYREAGDLKRAIDAIDRALDHESRLPDLYRFRADLYRSLSLLNNALDDRTHAANLELDRRGGKPSSEWMRDQLERADLLCRLGRYQEAYQACDAAAGVGQDASRVFRLRGEALLGQQRWAEALAVLNAYRETVPVPDADFWKKRALANLSLGQYKAALEDYTQAVDQQHDDAETRTLRGWAYLINNQPAEAEADFSRALEAPNPPANAWAGRALARIRLSNYPAALEDAEEAGNRARREPQPHVLYNAALAYAQLAIAVRNHDARIRLLPKPPRDLIAQAGTLLGLAIHHSPKNQQRLLWRKWVEGDTPFGRLRHEEPFPILRLKYGQPADVAPVVPDTPRTEPGSPSLLGPKKARRG
jgi:tetratricopeptide (TPR) repeat protein